MDFVRPDPDDLLKAVQHRTDHRGRLKIFLGASAGVGKTFAMLSEAHEQLKRGTDIVGGYVETHQRQETRALLEGLELIPLKGIYYKGSTINEVDVPAIIERSPQIVIIDELAHTNTPGSIHAKRWQDINDILDAGINVFTAVNIQHLESLNDVVAQVSGIRVQETIPDSFFDQADEIELIDLPPAELQKRLKEGKVYIPERVEHALEGFFKTSNLTALREIALRRTADSVDAEMQRLRTQEGTRGTWATKERIIVCVAPNQLGTRVVRAAARLAASSHAELIALTVESDRQTSRGHSEHEHAREALEIAEGLGIEVVNLHGHDIVAEIVAFATRRNCTLIVVGKPIRPRWREILFGSVVDELVRRSGDIDVHVITARPEETNRTVASRSTQPPITIYGAIIALSTVSLATLVSFTMFRTFGLANVAMLYVLGVVVSATKLNRTESASLSLVSVVTFNFCFVEPRFSFAVSDARYLFLFGVMVTVGLVISTLTDRLRSQLKSSSERERRTASLYALSRQLAQGKGKREVARSAVQEISSVFDGDAAVFLVDDGQLTILIPSDTQFEKLSNELAVARWVADHGEPAGLGTATLPGSSALSIPLRGSESVIGVLCFKPRETVDRIPQPQFLETFANGLGLALERTILAKQSNDARIDAESEKLRSTLLSSISHDLRTPLTSITGAASSLMQGHGDVTELSATIFSESVRLNHQIQNLLDMTRLQAGNVEIKRTWQSPQELISGALEKCKLALEDRVVTVNIASQSALFEADGLLVEKALINLIENAGRFTRSGDSITIKVFSEIGRVIFLISDSGPGIPADALGKLFKPGFRTDTGGFGLGLAIVEAIVKLHGGRVNATNAPEGGAMFRLEFPLPEKQPEVPVG